MSGDGGHVQELPREVLQVVNDDRRIAALNGLAVLDTLSDPDFDRLTWLAANLFAAPVALITLVDVDRQWFKSRVGTDVTETPVSVSFCAHAIAAAEDVTVIEDATVDLRFSDNPLVTGEEHVRFYAGVPIVVAGARLGTLCVLDRVARRRPTDDALVNLKALAALAASFFALKDSTRAGDLARAALAREEKRRAIAVEAAGLASWVWDGASDIVECDALLTELFNLPPATRLTAREIFFAIDRRDVSDAESRFRESLASTDDYFGEYRVKGVEPPRWLASRGRVVERDAEGKPLLVFGVNYDITERRGAEERQRLLLRELNHRVKNTLATVQALATQTVRHASEPRQFLEAFGGRLQALGLAHSLLSDHEWRGIGLAELVRREVKPFDNADRPRINISGKDVLLTPDQALGLGLILHELGSNAMKFGALSVPAGIVDLRWRIEGRNEQRRLVLNWAESGGPPVEPPARQGFGSILIKRSLSKILESEVRHEFPPEGVTAQISLPLEEVSEA